MVKFSDLKDKLKKAADFSEEEYDETFDETEYEDEEEIQQDDYEFSSNSFGSSNSYDFGSPSPSPSSFKSSYEQRASRPASKEGSNIYRMNNSASVPETTKVNRVLFFVLEDAEDARNIADCMIKKDSIVLCDMSKLSPADCNKVLNFLDGVRYITKSQLENINGLRLIVPDTISMTGDFYEQVSFGTFSGK